MIQLILLAIALAMDATAAASGLAASNASIKHMSLVAGVFGVFQSGMSALGWWGGVGVATLAAAWDHWIAFVLLVAVGAKTLREAFSEEEEEESSAQIGLSGILILALATSIDALAAGLTLPMLGVSGWISIAVIGVITSALSMGGGLMGRALGARFGGRLEMVGGLVLIALGIKILVEHLMYGI